MGCGFFKKQTMALLAIMLLSAVLLSVSAGVEELKGTDSWKSDDAGFEVIDNVMVLEGDAKTVVFDNEHNLNETIAFNARFSFEEPFDSWVAFKLRSDKPEKLIWQNDSTYFFLIRSSEICIGRVVDGMPVEYLIEQDSTKLSDGQQHEIEIGVINQGENSTPRLIFKIDGKKIIEYDDFSADDRLRFLNSMFSVDVFQGGRVEIETKPDPNNAYGSMVYRDKTGGTLQELDSYNDKWAILQHMGPSAIQYYKTEFRRNEQKLVLAGPGSLVYKDSMDSDSVSFDFVMTEHVENKTGSALVLLCKSNRDSYYGGNSLGFEFSSDGKAWPIVYGNDKKRKYPGISTGLDFMQVRKVGVEWTVENGGITLYLYVDSNKKAYEFRLDDADITFPGKHFLGVVNNSLTSTIEVSNIRLNGKTEEYTNDSELLPVYLQDYISEEGTGLLHWEYRADEESYYKVVIQDTDGNAIGEAIYPKNTFYLPKDSIYDHLFLKAENIDGNSSEKVMVKIDSPDKTNDSYLNEKITINPDDEYGAGFIYSDSKTPFFVNGFNYIKLRFGDHSTFEPGTGIINADYDPYSAETMLGMLGELGYNTVRIFISNGRNPGNQGTAGEYESGTKISPAYMENVIDFLERARRHGIYVLVCFGENEVPDNRYFRNLVPYSSQQDFLFNKDYMEAKMEYIGLFLQYIRTKDPTLMNSILAVQEQNEFSYNPQLEPFSITEGQYLFHGNGTAYDMSDADSRRELANEAFVHYISNVRRTLDEIDPGILLCIGTSTIDLAGVRYPEERGIFPDTDKNHPLTAVEYLAAEIDFLDIHSYNFTEPDKKGSEVIKNDMECMLLDTAECIEYRKEKPVILGEYGAVTGVQDSFDLARLYIIDQRNEAVLNNLKGTILWSFDGFSQNELYSAMEDNGNFLMQLSLFKPTNQAVSEGKRENWVIPVIIAILAAAGLAAAAFYIISRKKKKRSDEPGNSTSTAIKADTSNCVMESDRPFVCNLFGEFELYYKGRLQPEGIFQSVKARDLLIYMLSEDRAVSKDEIIEAIWGEKDNKNPDNLFHVTLYKLRKSLSSVDSSLEYIQCSNRLYSMKPGVFMCVHEEFGNVLETILSKDEPNASEIEIIQMNIDCYRNKYLHSYDYEWTRAKREYYHGLYEKALLVTARQYIENLDFMQASKNLNILTGINPYSEEAYLLMLDMHGRQGNRNECRKVFESYANQLSEDLGVESTDKFKNHYKKLMNQ